MTVVKETLANLAQLVARIMIKTNPAVISGEQCEAVCSIIVKVLLSEDCHHELLQFEGAMGLTNLASSPTYREKIVTLGGWDQAVELLINFVPERDSFGMGRTVLAVLELISNLSLSEQIQERAATLTKQFK